MSYHDPDSLVLQIVEWLNEDRPQKVPSGNHFVYCYHIRPTRRGSKQDLLGRTSPQGLLLALLTKQSHIDLYNEVAGGAVPILITEIRSIRLEA